MRRKNGFTLVEMLVVIAIIAILAALITPAVAGALWSARQTKIKVELDQLASGMEAFKAKYGSYPPTNLTCSSGVANANLQSFVAWAFPRYSLRWAGSLGAQIAGDLTNQGVDTTNVQPPGGARVLVGRAKPRCDGPIGEGTTSTARFRLLLAVRFFSSTLRGSSIAIRLRAQHRDRGRSLDVANVACREPDVQRTLRKCGLCLFRLHVLRHGSD